MALRFIGEDLLRSMAPAISEIVHNAHVVPAGSVMLVALAPPSPQSFLPLRKIGGLDLLPSRLRALSHQRFKQSPTALIRCSYGKANSRWVSHELERLLSSEVFSRKFEPLTEARDLKGIEDVCLPSIHDAHIASLANPYVRSILSLAGKRIAAYAVRFHNVTKRFEIFIAEVYGKLKLLGCMSLDTISTSIQILPRHPNGKPQPRDDGYWPAYITRAGATTSLEVLVDITSRAGAPLTNLQAARLDIEYISYGPHGRSTHVQHVILPLQYPDVFASNNQWRKTAAEGPSVLPIRTHLLSHLDDPLEVLRRYVLPHSKAGDVIAIGETPLAIMQGRFRHPRNVHPGLVAGLTCRLFHPTSSLATACGMQALIDISGRPRVVVAVLIAIIARHNAARADCWGGGGMFYRVAGEQARLIDDVTGTLPPYDQFITLGPIRAQDTVDALRTKTGCEVAIVDVNDLRRVQILAASHGVDHKLVKGALLENPAGNADEQTPIVLIRQ